MSILTGKRYVDFRTSDYVGAAPHDCQCGFCEGHRQAGWEVKLVTGDFGRQQNVQLTRESDGPGRIGSMVTHPHPHLAESIDPEWVASLSMTALDQLMGREKREKLEHQRMVEQVEAEKLKAAFLLTKPDTSTVLTCTDCGWDFQVPDTYVLHDSWRESYGPLRSLATRWSWDKRTDLRNHKCPVCLEVASFKRIEPKQTRHLSRVASKAWTATSVLAMLDLVKHLL